MNNGKLRHYECKKGFVWLYFDNGRILLITETEFAQNYQLFFDLDFFAIRKKFHVLLIG